MSERLETGFDPKLEGRDVIVTRLDAAISWTRKNSVWPMPMGLACCGIELMAVGASRFDIARFGSEVMRFSPRQCDLMIVAGTCVYKMAGVVKRVWDQMPNPKWCMAMVRAPAPAVCIVVTPSCKAWIISCRWMSTFPAVRRDRKLFSKA